MRWVLCLVVLALGLLPRPAAAAAMDLVPWQPSESYEGGKQYDARLDQTVHFWHAGMTLNKAFAGIGKQTGVKVEFPSATDDNARFPVSLFLSEKDPPSLRALLAQLSWVTDCAFVTQGETGKQRYLLLSSNVAEGAEARLAATAQARRDARVGWVRQVPARAEELRAALALSREEAIRRYRGKDDFLLLTLLDPSRRMAAELFCRHSKEAFPDRLVKQVGAFGGSSDLTFETYGGPSLEGLTPEDRSAVKTLFGAEPETLVLESYGGPVCVGSLADDGSDGMLISATVAAPALRFRPVSAGQPQPVFSYTVLRFGEAPTMQPEDKLALRRALGETLSEAEASQYLEEQRREAEAQWKERERVENQARRKLSAKAEAGLAAVRADLKPGASVPVWALQEAVARATDLSIVAEAMRWQEVSLSGGGGDPSPTALSALDAMDRESAGKPTWEWGDAGSFLRFRSVDRDMWRAAMLPPAALDRIDSLLHPYLPKKMDASTPQVIDAVVGMTPEQWTRLLAGLSNPQLTSGPRGNYGDPADPVNLLRHAFLRARLPHLEADWLRFCASLNPDQWKRLRGEGLTCPTDLSANQPPLLAAAVRHPGWTNDDLREVTGQLNLGAPPYGGDDSSLSLNAKIHTASGRGVSGPAVWFPKQVTIHAEIPATAPAG